MKSINLFLHSQPTPSMWIISSKTTTRQLILTLVLTIGTNWHFLLISVLVLGIISALICLLIIAILSSIVIPKLFVVVIPLLQ